MTRYCLSAAVGAVAGIVLLVLAAAVVSEFVDLNIEPL